MTLVVLAALIETATASPKPKSVKARLNQLEASVLELQGRQGVPGPPGPPGPTLFAVVERPGGEGERLLARSSTGVTLSHQGNGIFRLTFPQDVSGCAAIASGSFTLARAYVAMSSAQTIDVTLLGGGGSALQDDDFTLIASCP